MCENCKELGQRFNIYYPYELYSLIDDLKRLVKNNVLVYVDGNTFLDDIVPNKPWPTDVIEMKFQCPKCNQNFSLFCDTYHGGGKWLPFDL